jgi:hypothetical protein
LCRYPHNPAREQAATAGQRRAREYLTAAEVEKLISAAHSAHLAGRRLSRGNIRISMAHQS